MTHKSKITPATSLITLPNKTHTADI